MDPKPPTSSCGTFSHARSRPRQMRLGYDMTQIRLGHDMTDMTQIRLGCDSDMARPRPHLVLTREASPPAPARSPPPRFSASASASAPASSMAAGVAGGARGSASSAAGAFPPLPCRERGGAWVSGAGLRGCAGYVGYAIEHYTLRRLRRLRRPEPAALAQAAPLRRGRGPAAERPEKAVHRPPRRERARANGLLGRVGEAAGWVRG